MGKYRCGSAGILPVLLAAVLASLPSSVFGECGAAPNDGWGSNYSSYASWCTGCGGRPYNDNGVGCDMSGAPSGSSYTAPAVGGVQGAILQGIQNGIQQAQQDAALQKQRQQIENDRSAEQMMRDGAAIEEDAREKARLLEEQEKNSADKEKQTKARRAEEILSQMRGGAGAGVLPQQAQGAPSASLAPKDLAKAPSDTEKCARETDFKTYQDRAAERRQVLGRLSGYPPGNRILKARADWCKLHIPLPPSPSSADYCGQNPVYEGRMIEWRGRCAVVAEASSAAASPAQAAAGNTAKGSAKAGPAPDCLGVYDGETDSCSREDLILYSNCINKALRSFSSCMNFQDPAKGTPATGSAAPH